MLLSCVIVGDVLVATGFHFIFLVYRENTFTSATIEAAADQKVISTGPYAIVRHPMYASALVYLVGTPLALGSFWGLLALLAMMPFLIWRLYDGEAFSLGLCLNIPNTRRWSGIALYHSFGRGRSHLSLHHYYVVANTHDARTSGVACQVVDRPLKIPMWSMGKSLQKQKRSSEQHSFSYLS